MQVPSQDRPQVPTQNDSWQVSAKVPIHSVPQVAGVQSLVWHRSVRAWPCTVPRSRAGASPVAKLSMRRSSRFNRIFIAGLP